MIDIEEGEYVRTTYGTIDKFLYKDKFEKSDIDRYVFEKNKMSNPELYVVKHSKKLIDLLELGDYVNEYRVIEINYEEMYIIVEKNYDCDFFEEDIKNVVTKEQFEKMKYIAKED